MEATWSNFRFVMRFAENFQVLFGKPLKIPLLHTDLFGCAGGRQVTSVYIVECLLYIYIWYPPPQDPYFLRIYWYLRYFVVFYYV